MAIEVGTHSPWVSRTLEALGHEVTVANARQVPLIYKSRRKNDKLDAEKLARVARLDATLLKGIRHRGEEGQGDLMLIRARAQLVETRTGLMNMVRGLVKSRGERLAGCTTEGFVVELLEGMDLEALVERFGPVPAERAIHLLRQACDSLGEAHDRGLMHRDIKPSNIHTCRMGLAVDFVKLLDFGLVKPQPGREASAPTLTRQDSGVPGTPAFMAPEAVFGDPVPDHRADIYALGCVGYWLLTGALVFEAASTAQMLMQHFEALPTPPSRRTETEIPAGLEALILECLAKRPQDRPATAAELARRLAACPVRQAWTEERAREWWDRHLPSGSGGGLAEHSGESGSLRGSTIRPRA